MKNGETHFFTKKEKDLRKWSIAHNNMFFTATLILEEAPWYVYMIDSIFNFLCHYFPNIPLPKIKIKVDGEKYTMREYYGTTGDLFHLYIHDPIIHWFYKRIKETHVHLPYQYLQTNFPEDVQNPEEYFSVDPEIGWGEEDVKKIKENRKYSDEVYKEFAEAWKKVINISNERMKYD